MNDRLETFDRYCNAVIMTPFTLGISLAADGIDFKIQMALFWHLIGKSLQKIMIIMCNFNQLFRILTKNTRLSTGCEDLFLG
jgi:hypothetical protein